MTKDPMLVIVPTRGRPQNIVRLEQALADTGTERADFLYAVDPDDPKLEEYLALDLRRIVVLEERMRLSRTLNHLAQRNAGQYGVIGFMGDDHVPVTPGWDKRIMEVMEAGAPRIAYGNDLLQGANLPTAVFMHSKIIARLGYMCPVTMTHLYLDNFWKELGQGLDGLVYLDDVVIEHVHPAAGKAPMDEGYREANAAEQDRADREAWLAYRDHGLLYSIVRVLDGYRS